MENLIWLIGGFLLGWVVEWLVDFFFWRRPAGEDQSRLIALEAAQARNQALESERSQLQSLVEDHAAVAAERDAARAEVARLEAAANGTGRLKSDLAGAREALEAANAALLAEQSRSTELETERDALQAHLAAGNGAPNADLEKQLAEEQDLRRSCIHELSQAQTEIARLERELAAKRDAVAVALGGRAGFAANADETMIAMPVTPDDLTRVKGIGPKIQGLLQQAGIQTFGQLAQASVGQLDDILDQAGERFKLAVPETWPAQAMLAARADWSTLSALQKQIQIGRRQAEDEDDDA